MKLIYIILYTRHTAQDNYTVYRTSDNAQHPKKYMAGKTFIQLDDFVLKVSFGDPTDLLFPTHPFTPTTPS